MFGSGAEKAFRAPCRARLALRRSSLPPDLPRPADKPGATAPVCLENASQNGTVCFTSEALPLATQREDYAVVYTHTGDDIVNTRVALTFSGAANTVFLDRVMLKSLRKVSQQAMNRNLLLHRLGVAVLSLLASVTFAPAVDARADSKQDITAADPVAAVFQRMKHGICVGNFERDQDLKAVAELDADYLDSVRDAGFRSIRFFFNNHKQPEFYATNVAHALKQGLVVNVCMFMFTNDRQQYVNRWREIATFYKDSPESLVFELFNEPSLAPKLNDPVEVMDWINAAVAAIRAVSPQRILLIGGPSYMQAPFLAKYVTPEYLTYTLSGGGGFAEDRYVMGAFHMYEPHAYTMPKGKLVTVDDFPSWKKLVTDNLDLAAAWGKKWNKRVVLTEWAAQSVPKQRDDFLAYTKFVFDEVNQRDIASIYYAGLPRNSLMASWNILDTEFGWDQGVLDIITRTKAKPVPSLNQLANSEFSEFENQGAERGIKAWQVTSAAKPSVVNSASLSGVFALKLVLDGGPATLSQDTLTMIESWQKTDPMFAHETALAKPFIHLRRGNTYRLTFLARAEKPGATATVRLENAAQNGVACFTSAALPLATGKEERAVEYTHTGEDIMNTRVALTFSGAANTVFVDRIILKSHRTDR